MFIQFFKISKFHHFYRWLYNISIPIYVNQ